LSTCDSLSPKSPSRNYPYDSNAPSTLTPLVDPFGRAITYVRVSVADRCDFRRAYCMSEDMNFLPKRDVLSLEELDAVIAAMPVETAIERRNRALIAFAILTGMRDRALVSLSLRHVDLSKSPPLVPQEPDRVAAKFAKNINTYFSRLATIFGTSLFALLLAVPRRTRAAGEQARHIVQDLLLPAINMVRMHAMPLGQLRNRRILPQRFQRHLRLERLRV
jgi:hypothetical protein